MRHSFWRQLNNRTFKRVVCLLVTMAMVVTVFPNAVYAKDTIGSRITIEKIDGSVSVVKANGKSAAAKTGVKLNASETLRTDKASYAYISIDDDKVIKLDELTDVNVKKSGNKLSVEVNEGSIFFEVKEKLEDKESMSINASSMAMSIRGTAGIIGVRKVGDEIVSNAELIEGSVNITYDGKNNKNQEIVLTGGEEISHVEGEDNADKEEININDFPGFAAVELVDNEELCEKIKEDNNLDTDWIKENAQKLLENDQKDNAEKYSDVFTEGSTSSVASLVKNTGVNKFLKTFWEKGKGLTPVKTGVITPTPLPSQAPVNTITLTPTPTPVPSATQVAQNNGDNAGGGGQGSTTIIVSSPGEISPANLSVNTVPPSIMGGSPAATASSDTSSSSSDNSSSSARTPTIWERFAALSALNYVLGMFFNRNNEASDDRESYTVTYIGQDGVTVLMTQTVKSGDTATPPEPPVLPGYTFSSWGGALTDITSDRKIYALYTKDRFDVYFYDTLGSVSEPYSVQYDVLTGEYAVSPGNPMHSGYTFIGWYTTLPSGEKSSLGSTPITSTMTFYASYEEAKQEEHEGLYVITFKGFDGEIVGVKEVEYGYIIQDSDVPTVEKSVNGYDFTGWDVYPYRYQVTTNVEFNAQYKKSEQESSINKIKVNLQFTCNGASQVYQLSKESDYNRDWYNQVLQFYKSEINNYQSYLNSNHELTMVIYETDEEIYRTSASGLENICAVIPTLVGKVAEIESSGQDINYILVHVSPK